MLLDWTSNNSWLQQKPINSWSRALEEGLIEYQIRLRQAKANKTPHSAVDLLTSEEAEAIQTARVLIQQISEPGEWKIVKSFRLATCQSRLNVTFTETTSHQETPKYYAVHSEVGAKQPDIVLYAGQDESGDRLATAYFRSSRHVRMDFGGRKLRNSAVSTWEMSNTSHCHLGHSRYSFQYDRPYEGVAWGEDLEPIVVRDRKIYTWLRTRDKVDGVNGFLEQTVGWRNYRLMEHTTRQPMAVLLVSMFSGLTRGGFIHFYQAVPEELERVVLFTAACIWAKGHRMPLHWPFGCLGI